MLIGWGWLCRHFLGAGYLYTGGLLSVVCTLVIAWQVFPDTPLVVAANRDESNGRHSHAPSVYHDIPRTIAPRDARAGGTWIGYNDCGLFVGITNRWVDRDGDRSRGQLVADCLEYGSTTAAARHVRRSIDSDQYAGFNLVVTDFERAVLFEFDGTLSVTEFDPGVHVVVNVGADGDFFEPTARPEVGRQQAATAERLRAVLAPASDESASEWLSRAGEALGDHEYDVCVHGDGFGTRSSSLIQLTSVDGRIVDDYWFADGPPCRTAFRQVESSL